MTNQAYSVMILYIVQTLYYDVLHYNNKLKFESFTSNIDKPFIAKLSVDIHFRFHYVRFKLSLGNDGLKLNEPTYFLH